MPIIQQENGVKMVAGLPVRWGVRAYRELSAALAGEGGAKSDRYKSLAQLLDDVTAAPLPLDSTDAQLCILAEERAAMCVNLALDLHTFASVRAIMDGIVRSSGIEPPNVKGDQAAVLRCMDAVWWRRSLRKVIGRAREHAAIRLGFVSSRAGKYCSDEAARSRVAQNRRNAITLENTKLLNVDTDQQYKLSDLAAKGTGNNKIRRGELMLRMDGCDEIAAELGHKGLFVTLTAPGSYHAVLEQSGEINPNYNGASPRDTQTYLNDSVWKLTRAQNGRDGIAPYGFRVAEPHHDGCTHWHMVLFMPAEHIPIFVRNLSNYALAEDGNAPGAQTKRVTFKELDPAAGTAAAYMAKYVSKNIGDGKIELDKNGNEKITKEMRVDAWAGLWGIRQFQPLGQPPVTGYREFRRVPESAIEDAPEHVRQAWRAGNRISLIDEETGEVAGVQKCDFAVYIRAQGGINRGRDYRIAVATEQREVAGRYGLQVRDCPTGVFCKSEPATKYASIRYTWKRLGVAVELRRSWSPVNNCTEPDWFTHSIPGELVAEFDDAWFDSDEYKKFFVPPEVVADEWNDAERAAAEIRAATVWTSLSSDKLRAPACG
jgi:hypothetical protein